MAPNGAEHFWGAVGTALRQGGHTQTRARSLHSGWEGRGQGAVRKTRKRETQGRWGDSRKQELGWNVTQTLGTFKIKRCCPPPLPRIL